jgi:hypothetical protein
MRLEAGIQSTSFETAALRPPQDEVGYRNVGES